MPTRRSYLARQLVLLLLFVACVGCSSVDYSAEIQALKHRIEELEGQLSSGHSNQVDIQSTDEVRTRELKIVDGSGNVRCQIGVSDGNATQFTLYTSGGQLGVILAASDAYNGMVVNGWQETGINTSGITIAQNRQLGPSIAISHSNGQPAFSAQVINDSALLGLASARAGSKPQIEMRVGSEREATVQVLDANYVGRVLFGVSAQNQPSVGLIDRRGVGRISLQMDRSDVPQMALHGSNGELRGAFGMGSSNNVAVFILDANGRPKKIIE